MTHGSAAAEGWYRDPYGIHQDRWFSAGNPTALVRDQGVEGHDDPPGYPPPGPPAEIGEIDRFPADDLRRADDRQTDGGRYNEEAVIERAGDAAATGYAGDDAW